MRRSAVVFNARRRQRVLQSGMNKLSDADLVALARSGDGEAFGELVRRYQRPAYSVALAITGNHHDAEDVAQESFVVALERLDDCRNPDRFVGWLLSTVRNRARNLVRREKVRLAGPIPPDARTDVPSPARAAQTAALRGKLEEALETLSEVQREVLLLHDLEGWKHNEIAERLSIPAGTVRSHLHFARKALRARMAPWREDGDDL